ncbi:hypothetical protein U9M48_029787, partial [Paspalum notatum var. saurae]
APRHLATATLQPSRRHPPPRRPPVHRPAAGAPPSPAQQPPHHLAVRPRPLAGRRTCCTSPSHAPVPIFTTPPQFRPELPALPARALPRLRPPLVLAHPEVAQDS